MLFSEYMLEFWIENMVEALRSSLVLPMKVLGHNSPYVSKSHDTIYPLPSCFYCCSYLSLGIHTNKWHAGFLDPASVLSSDGSCTSSRSFAVGKARLKAPSLELQSVTRDDQKEIFDEHHIEQKSPPWGNLAVGQCFDGRNVEPSSKPLVVAKGKGSVRESRLQYLEERDEEVLSKRLLKLSRLNKVRTAVGLFRSMEFSGLRPSLHACNSLLSCLIRAKRIDDALQIFEFMKSNERTTGHTYSLVLKGIADARGCEAAFDLFEELVGNSDLKNYFDTIVYDTMIAVAAKQNNWYRIEIFWRSMKANGHVGSSVTYRLLVCSFVRCGQHELALDAYHEMVQNGLKPADDAMQAVVGAYVKEGKWESALHVFQKMLNFGMKPNVVTCNTLINALGKVGKVKLALKVYSLMESLGHTPDAYTWNGLIGALSKANRHEDALLLFKNIQLGKSIVLNLHLYNTALMSCNRLGLWDRAIQLLWEMEDSGISLSTASYNLVIGACEVARKPKVALQVYKHMVQQKHIPDTFTLLSLLRCCIWGSLWHEVDKILDHASPNGSFYNAAIQGLFLRGRIDSAKKHYLKMRELGLKPDGKTRALMLQHIRER